eukprot:CAMPEP_0181433368 /NCGR_PEP_ID=MMETSP1110-20121109/19253_1 /TAXON_ID=174948 /ORGANISM="Symbiodinium sp., Strain CCMP421" /LENGTH=63 /DNA_ID=CAMNT_0023556813 /DNA_START=398 /DNA_END=586 /DNA_ORIENTATION=-
MAAVLRKAVVMAGRMTAPDDCPTLGDGSSSRLAKVLGVAFMAEQTTYRLVGCVLMRNVLSLEP